VSANDELDLFIKDRGEHIETLIDPSLKAGKIVLCDRYFLSTAAYQGAAGCNPETIIARHRFAPEPDLAIIIEVPPEICISRIIEKRGDQLNDFEQLESLKKVDSIFKQMDLPYIYRIDGSVAEEEVHRQVRGLIERLLPQLFLSASGEHH
jgi:dTMP kinase